MRTSNLKIATIAGIDIFIHWSWLIIVGLLTLSLGDYYYVHFADWSHATAYIVAAVSAVLLFATVLLHELAHSLVARRRGLPVTSITLYIFGGVAGLAREPDDPQTELLVALAGPVTSLLLAGICLAIFAVSSSTPTQVQAVLHYLAFINVILVAFNMIPAFPMDGGRVFRAITWWITGNRRRATRIASIIGRGIGYLFILAGLAVALFGGDVFGGIYLAFIGWFLTSAANASTGQVMVEQVLRGVDVRDVMDGPPPLVSPFMSVGNLIDFHVLGQSQRAVPVAGPDDTLGGLITLADVRDIPREEWTVVPLGRIMRPVAQLATVTPADDLADALRIMAERGYHQLPVMNDGHMVGMLNREHVLQYLHIRSRLQDATP